MKLKSRVVIPVVWFVCLLPLLLDLGGCLTKTPVVSQQPVVSQVPQIVTMPVVVPTQVTAPNGTVTTVFQTNQVSQTNMVNQTNWVSATNFVYSPNAQQIQSVAGTIGTINAATAPLNPYAPIISTAVPWGTTIAFAISTGIAAFLNNKKAGVIQAIVAGVEGAAPSGGNDTTPVTVAQVKASVATQAALMGVSSDVHATVQKLT